MKKNKNRDNILRKIAHNQKLKFIRPLVFVLMIIPISLLLGLIFFLSYIDTIQKELPSPDDPFKHRNQSSIIYSVSLNEKNENIELYRLFDTENRNLLSIEDVPDHVKWAVLAAEDIDFYDHPGFDLGGLYKATLYNVFGIGEERGGSTITQQLVKQTTVGSAKTLDRKIRELILSVRVEEKYDKDQILEMYLNTNNYGGNIYGLKTAAKFYFNKEVKELTLAEAALLARIPQNPAFNSPTLALDEKGLERALSGRDFVLDQMKVNLEKINNHIVSDDHIVLVEEIDAAKVQELKFQDPRIALKAPHFVFYIQGLLTQFPYNNGQPFTLEELQTGGYKIYTTLNDGIQKIAEEEVLNGVNQYSMPRGGHNGAAIVVSPSNGDILAMVGSKNFFGQSEGSQFDGKVNVTTTLQSMGSSMKPVAYYKAFQLGLATPGSYLPDVPIQIGGYRPKNWDGSFMGYQNGATPRQQLSRSRNIPAVMLVDTMGAQTYTQTLSNFGYFTIAQNPQDYGPSLVLGGGDITMVEHVQGYTVFANGGDMIKIDPIKKITKYNADTDTEEIVYEKKVERKELADPRSVYMVNHILNYKNGGPGAYIDGRDFSGKTGTSELHKDTIYAGYTPEFVIVGWNGNNDNTPMIYGSWGENVTKPWVINLSKRITGYFPEKVPFNRPGGINTYKGDLSIEGKIPNNSFYLKYAPPIPTPTPSLVAQEP